MQSVEECLKRRKEVDAIVRANLREKDIKKINARIRKAQNNGQSNGGEHPYNGTVVPEDAYCVLCGKEPKPGEQFGCKEKDWDASGMICPRCFPKEEDIF